MTRRLLVLCYHNVVATPCFPSRPGAGQRGLERQLRTLRRWANVVPLDEAVGALAIGRPLPPRAVALSFDDGYRDNLTLAVPMLERLGLPATFFLVPGLLANEAVPWWEVLYWAVGQATASRLRYDELNLPLTSERERRRAADDVAGRLKRRTRADRDAAVAELATALAPIGQPPSAGELFLDWDEAPQLLTRGFTVGSHTCAHAILSGETPEDQARDLAASRRELQDRLGVDADLLAYPNGTPLDYDAATLDGTARAGYRFAFTTREGFNEAGTPPFELRRVVLYPERGPLDLLATLRYALRPAESAR